MIAHESRRQHTVRTLASAAVLVVAAALASSCSSTTPVALPAAAPEVVVAPLPDGEDVRIDRVVDGDTLVAADRRIRIIGIDTPETVKPGGDIECFGPEASAATTALLPRGELVRLVTDRERTDRYDRELAYVYRVRDGLFVPAYLVREGFARALSIKPNTRHRTELDRLQADAAGAGRGLWSAC